jgi:hypothetical protein
MAARFDWACDDPREIEGWNIGLRLKESRTLLNASDAWLARLSLPMRSSLRILRTLCPQVAKSYQLNSFELR